MGLENFTSGGGDDDDEDEEPSSSTETTESTSSSTDNSAPVNDTLDGLDMDFYNTQNANPGTRPMERKGAMSEFTYAGLQDSKEGNVEIDRDSIKYHLPMFALLTCDQPYEQGQRYQLKHQREPPRASWNGKVVRCTTCTETTLGEVNREMVMLAAGTTSKKRAMEFMDSKFDEDISGDTTVYVSYMLDAMFARDLAQASEQFRAGDNLNRDDIARRVIQPKMLRLALDKRNED